MMSELEKFLEEGDEIIEEMERAFTVDHTQKMEKLSKRRTTDNQTAYLMELLDFAMQNNAGSVNIRAKPKSFSIDIEGAGLSQKNLDAILAVATTDLQVTDERFSRFIGLSNGIKAALGNENLQNLTIETWGAREEEGYARRFKNVLEHGIEPEKPKSSLKGPGFSITINRTKSDLRLKRKDNVFIYGIDSLPFVRSAIEFEKLRDLTLYTDVKVKLNGRSISKPYKINGSLMQHNIDRDNINGVVALADKRSTQYEPGTLVLVHNGVQKEVLRPGDASVEKDYDRIREYLLDSKVTAIIDSSRFNTDFGRKRISKDRAFEEVMETVQEEIAVLYKDLVTRYNENAQVNYRAVAREHRPTGIHKRIPFYYEPKERQSWWNKEAVPLEEERQTILDFMQQSCSAGTFLTDLVKTNQLTKQMYEAPLFLRIRNQQNDYKQNLTVKRGFGQRFTTELVSFRELLKGMNDNHDLEITSRMPSRMPVRYLWKNKEDKQQVLVRNDTEEKLLNQFLVAYKRSQKDKPVELEDSRIKKMYDRVSKRIEERKRNLTDKLSKSAKRINSGFGKKVSSTSSAVSGRARTVSRSIGTGVRSVGRTFGSRARFVSGGASAGGSKVVGAEKAASNYLFDRTEKVKQGAKKNYDKIPGGVKKTTATALGLGVTGTALVTSGGLEAIIGAATANAATASTALAALVHPALFVGTTAAAVYAITKIKVGKQDAQGQKKSLLGHGLSGLDFARSKFSDGFFSLEQRAEKSVAKAYRSGLLYFGTDIRRTGHDMVRLAYGTRDNVIKPTVVKSKKAANYSIDHILKPSLVWSIRNGIRAGRVGKKVAGVTAVGIGTVATGGIYVVSLPFQALAKVTSATYGHGVKPAAAWIQHEAIPPTKRALKEYVLRPAHREFRTAVRSGWRGAKSAGRGLSTGAKYGAIGLTSPVWVPAEGLHCARKWAGPNVVRPAAYWVKQNVVRKGEQFIERGIQKTGRNMNALVNIINESTNGMGMKALKERWAMRKERKQQARMHAQREAEHKKKLTKQRERERQARATYVTGELLKTVSDVLSLNSDYLAWTLKIDKIEEVKNNGLESMVVTLPAEEFPKQVKRPLVFMRGDRVYGSVPKFFFGYKKIIKRNNPLELGGSQEAVYSKEDIINTEKGNQQRIGIAVYETVTNMSKAPDSYGVLDELDYLYRAKLRQDKVVLKLRQDKVVLNLSHPTVHQWMQQIDEDNVDAVLYQGIMTEILKELERDGATIEWSEHERHSGWDFSKRPDTPKPVAQHVREWGENLRAQFLERKVKKVSDMYDYRGTTEEFREAYLGLNIEERQALIEHVYTMTPDTDKIGVINEINPGLVQEVGRKNV